MRKWLQENEIFFKTAAYLLLPAIAIVISMQANIIAQRQTEIAEGQSEILRREKLPIISMTVDKEVDQKAGTYSEDILRIVNDGAPLQDLEIYKGVFFLAEYGRNGESTQRALLPVNGYYLFTTTMAQTTGPLRTLFTPQNGLTFHQIQQRFHDYAEDTGAFGSLTIQRYFEINYRDIFGEEHKAVYYVDPISGGSELSSGIRRLAAIQAIKLHREAGLTGLLVDFEDTSPERILAQFDAFQTIKRQAYPILHYLWQT